MSNGQQLAAEAYDRYLKWEEKLLGEDGDVESLCRNGSLNRTKCAKKFECDRGVFRSNKRISEAFIILESKLRDEGKLKAKSPSRKSIGKGSVDDQTEKLRQKINQLEQDNFRLQLSLDMTNKKEQRFSELSETMSELGIII